MITKICEQCGEEYKIKPSWAPASRFCSRECMGKWNSENRCGENSSRWNGGKVTKICEQCGEEYKIKPSAAETSRFCSRGCMSKWKSEKVRGEKHSNWKGGKITKICEQCGEEYKTAACLRDVRRFCSLECFGRWQSESRRGENSSTWNGGKVTKICEQCGEEYKINPSKTKRSHCCSKECQNKWQSGENAHNWNGGTSFEPYCHKFNETFKESIRDKFGRVCFLCPITEEENGQKLSVHHVNYDKNCLCDDSDCEFVPLCIRCHAKTNSTRGYWENIIMQKLTAL